ncbi:MAG TPA: DUF2207 domain-containing protein, partial [Longimicrobiales bacterium]|nr:DUF2207 domain-containing protein [Longimicrobiales bacterium]
MKNVVAIATLALLTSLPLEAQERIRSYDSEIMVQADGSIAVTEHITVRAEGSEIRRGIYRDIPTKYNDRYGNRVRIDLHVVGVERNGQPEAWFTERLSNGLRINTGGDDYLPELPGEYTFTLRYRATRQLGFFDTHDELYWNAIGTGWIFPIESGSVVVRLPEAVPIESLGAEGYTGPQGAQGTAYEATIPEPGVAHYRLTAPLGSYEGFTVVMTFPKGLIAEPTRGERIGWFLRDNRGVLVALAGLLALLLYAFVTWSRVGRDPRRGVVIPRYEPPEEHTPASLRYVSRMGYDMRCFSADILALAIGGHVKIHREKKRFSSGEWQLERMTPAGVPGGGVATRSMALPHATQKPLLDGLLGGRSRIVMKDTNAAIVASARDDHSKALDAVLHPRYFERNTRVVWPAALIVVATGVVAFLASGGAGIPAIIAIMVTMLIVLLVFRKLAFAPTREGRRLMDEIEGLKLFLSVAERDELARLQAPGDAPQVDAERYEALLPYAVALEVEDAWTKKFTAAVGAAAVAVAAQRMDWYSGSRPSDLGDFSRAIGSSLTSSIASASTPPGSSSGS